MEIISLVDDITDYKGIRAAHGLSFLIRTRAHVILFDFGPDGSTLKKNAAALGVDLADVDIAFLSHGHIDHGGGMEYFLQANKRAKIYCKENAFVPHLSKRGFTHVKIGVPEFLKKNSRIKFVNNFRKIDDEITVFSGVEDKILHSEANDNLEAKPFGQGRVKDDFSHEINLVINDGGKKYLICGCGHCGIVNILRKAEKCTSSKMTAAIGGFHLQGSKMASDKTIMDLADYLYMRYPHVKFYTCHCTGASAFGILKQKMGEQVEYIICGDRLQLV